MRSAARCTEGPPVVSRRALRLHPSARSFLGVFPTAASPYSLPLRCPGVPRSSDLRSCEPQVSLRLLPGSFARRMHPASASPLLPRAFPCWSPLRVLARPSGIPPSSLPAPHKCMCQSSAGSPRLLPAQTLRSKPAIRNPKPSLRASFLLSGSLKSEAKRS